MMRNVMMMGGMGKEYRINSYDRYNHKNPYIKVFLFTCLL